MARWFEIMSGAVDGEGTTSSDDAWLRALAAAPPRQPSSRYEPLPSLEVATVVDETFRIDGELGRGAMGVVYLATDLALDRRVALKLHASREADPASSRMWREAKAMARLAHPNVIAVHEVGLFGDRVYIAMELVEGGTLGEWLEQPRSWREVVAVFVQAGRGLAAAHRVGLVHRDFKPSNVLVDAEGRARVADFGLARVGDQLAEQEASLSDSVHTPLGRTRTGVAVGTPAYMAPEQAEGETVDHRSDQFAFFVTLHEALYGVRPFEGDTIRAMHDAAASGRVRPSVVGRRVPGWLRAIVLRGLQPLPERRFPDMNAVVAALLADPSRRRRWTIAAVATGTLAVTAAFGLALDRQRRAAECDDGAHAIDDTWNASTREEVHAGFLGTNAALADSTFERAAAIVDNHAARWREHYARLCTATVIERERSPELWAASQTCLDDVRGELSAWLDVLAHEADAGMVSGAVLEALRLERVELCADDRRLARAVDRPEFDRVHNQMLWRAKALEVTGRFEEALALTDRILAEVGDTAPEARAATLAQAGILSGWLGRFDDAERLHGEAFALAMAHGDDDTALTAALESVFVISESGQRDAEALVWSRVAEGLLERLGEGEGREAAALHVSLGRMHWRNRRLDEAEREHTRALEIAEPLLGAEHLDVAAIRIQLGVVARARKDYDEAERQYRAVLDVRTRILGERHPDIAETLNNLGVLASARGDTDEGQRLVARALEIWTEALGPDHPSTAGARINLAQGHQDAGRLDDAERELRIALRVYEQAFGNDHPQVAKVQEKLEAVRRLRDAAAGSGTAR